MFDFVAKHKRILQIVLFLTIIPFAFFGLESYTKSMRGAGDVATVNGTSISQREFADELRRQQERVRAMIGRDADISMFDTPEMRRAVLESMISQRLLLTEVVSANLALSKDAVVSAILAAPDFQEGGRFSSERYSDYLRSRGMSDEGNVAQLRAEIPAGRLVSALSATAFQPRSVARRLLALEGQKREVAEALIGADAYLGQVKPDEKQLKAYYDANAAQFQVPERVRAEYLVLSAEDLGRGEPVTEEELKKAYEAKLGQSAAAEQRRASHILLKTKEEADKVLAEARQSPQRFAELAKKLSQDTGSAENGGDLGQVSRGSLAAKPLEDAIFGLKANEVGGPVQTEFGYHVVRVTTIQASKEKSFDEMKKDLATDLAKQKGAKKFGEAAQDFNNLVYEQSDSLKPAAERYKLKPATTGWLTRQAVANAGALANPKLIAALFSPEAIQQRRNTDAIEVAPGVLVAARVAEHQAATQRPLEEVRADVERRVTRQEAAALARKEGAAKLAALAKGEDAGLKWGAPKTISRREPQGLPADALKKVMAAAAKLPAYAGADRGDQGYSIFRVEKLIEVDGSAQSPEDLARLDGQVGAEQMEAYLAALRARAKIEINPAGLEKK